MGNWWMGIGLLVAGLAILQGLLIGLQTWEHRRFARSRLRTHGKSPRPTTGRAVLFVPCRGLDEGLEENLRRLFVQDYANYELRFILEDRYDPAYPVIQRLREAYPQIRSRIIFAGRAEHSGQKVHNLRRATEHLPDDVEYLAFVDADARPAPHWLTALLACLEQPGVGAATGYRWFIPQRPTLANHLLYSLNCNIAMLFSLRGPNLVWGGSWAIRRDVFERLELRQAWQGTLSDDFVATRVLYEAGLHIAFEPACTVASPLDVDMPEMLSFLRRQYLIGRVYAPLAWALGFGLIAFANLVFLASLALTVGGMIAGAAWTWMPAVLAGLVHLSNAGRGLIRHDLALRYFPQARDAIQKAGRFDCWAGPLITLVNGAGLIASLVGRQITWRGITYRLYRGGQIATVCRNDTQPLPSEEIYPMLDAEFLVERKAA
jgi:ceramide glucosyltransferase